MKLSALVLTILLCLPLFTSALPVTVIRHDLGEIPGELLRVTEDTVVLEGRELPRAEVRRLRFGRAGGPGDGQGVEPPLAAERIRQLAAEARKQFPGAGYISLIDHKIDEYLDATRSVSIYHAAIYIARDEYKSLARIASWVDESRFRFIVEFGRILYPDGTEYRMDPAQLVKSVPKDDGVAFFSNRGAVLYYNFPRPAAGCIVEYRYRYETFLPSIEDLFASRFLFNGDQPALSSELEVVMPAEKTLHFRARNMSEAEARPRESLRADGKRVYAWRLGVQPPIIPEPQMPDLQQIAKTVTYSNHPDMGILFAWRQKVMAENMKVTPFVRETVDQILAGVPDDPVAITRHLYHWMQREIRYVSIKSGTVSGQAGHPADETLRNRFGDCVDKSVLFCTMLRARGIEANPVSIRTNNEAEMEDELPLIDANHSISRVFLPGGPLILDTTSTNHSFPYFRQDDHGVPAYDDLRGEVIRTPVPPPEDNLSLYRRTLEVAANGRFTVQFAGRYNGNRAANLRAYYKTVAEQDLARVFAGLAKQDAPDAELVDFRVHDLDDLFRDFGLDYHYRSREFLQPAGDLYILRNVSTLPFSFAELALDERRYDLEYPTSLRRENVDSYQLAANWSIRYLPPAVEIDNPYVHYSHSWVQEGNRLVFRNRYDLKTRIVPVADYVRFKRDVQRILEAQKENVILERREPKRYADLLILKDGSELEGEMIECGPAGVLFELRDGSQRREAPDQVLSLELADKAGGGDAELLDVLDEDLKLALTVPAGVEQYPGDLKVILLDRHDYRFEADGRLQHSLRQIVRVLKEKGKAAGFDNWNFDPERETLNIDHARSINGPRVTPLSSRTVKTAVVHAPWPEYVRQKNLKFALPEVQAGTVLDYKMTRITRGDPFLHPPGVALSRGSGGDAVSTDAGHNESWNPAPAFFAAVEPLVRKVVTIDLPADMEMDIAILHDPEGMIEQRTVRSGDRIIHEFRNRAPLPARLREDSQPPIGEFWPHLRVMPRKNWADLYAECGSRFCPSPTELQSARAFLAEKLGKNPGVEAIHRFVALEIAHLPVGLRDHGEGPASLEVILQRRKAGVLDAAWLLCGLLQAAGYEAELAFLPSAWYSRSIDRLHPDLAPLGIVAVRLRQDKQIRWLDPSDDLVSFAGSGSWLQGRDALVAGRDGFRVEAIPLDGTEGEETSIRARLTDEGDLTEFHYEYRPRGTRERAWRRLRTENREQWPILARGQAVAFHANATLKSFHWAGVEDLRDPVEVTMELEIPRFAIPAGDLRLFHLPDVNRIMPRDAVPETRHYAGVDLGADYRGRRTLRIALPPGWKLRYRPADVHFSSQWAALTAEIDLEGETLVYREEERILQPQIPRDEYARYRAYRKAMADFARDFVILERQEPGR